MSVLLFLAVLVVLVLAHEFGHFLAARRFGMRVFEFGVGFPPKLWSTIRGRTEYSVNALPFGGFVRIMGEERGDPVPPGENPGDSFSAKPKRAQAAVLVAGVAANILLAWFLFSVGFMIGMPATEEGARFGPVKDAKLTVTRVLKNTPAEASGMLTGDVVLKASSAGEAFIPTSPGEFSDFINRHGGARVEFEVLRSGKVHTVAVVPAVGIIAAEPLRAAVGVATGMVGTLKLAPPFALLEGGALTASMTADVARGIGLFLFSALTLNADVSNITGPVGIVSLVGDASSLGVVYLLSFVAFISLNLAIVNLIPFPALDGGRLLFLGIEAVKGTPLPVAAVRALNAIGFALLILLMAVVTYQDILRLAAGASF